jgi:hypothetical protein
MALVGLLWPVISLAQGSMNPIGQGLTPDQAIAALRSVAKPGNSLQILRALAANASTRRVGEQSLREARERHIKLYGNGILADVLINGGFLVAEVEPATRSLVGLHLVSVGRHGRRAIFPYRVNSDVRFDEAAKLVQDTTDFAEVLLSTPASEATSLESRFYGGTFPEYDKPEDGGAFAIPRIVLKAKARQQDYHEWTALAGGFILWMFQYAMSLPTYAANPLAALRAAVKEQDALAAQFMRDNKKSPDFRYEVQSPQLVGTGEEARERIDWLRRLNDFLEENLKKHTAADVVAANKTIATITWEVEAITKGGDTFFATMASGVVVYWQRLPTGGFAVKDISGVDAEGP